jgi:hypothetical protein
MSLEYTQRIRTWMTETVPNGGIERFDDLHIDRIDPTCKQRSTWIHSAVSMFRMSLKVRDDLQLPVKIVLTFSLRSVEKRVFDSIPALEAELDRSPPSLYVFPPEHAFDKGASSQSADLPKEMVLDLPPEAKSRILAFRDIDGEYRRTLLIEE